MSPAVFILFVSALVLFFALFSFWKAMMSFLGEEETSAADSTETLLTYDPTLLTYAPLSELEQKKEQALMQLKDLEREEKLGRVTRLDYQVLREELLIQTREIFAQEEEILKEELKLTEEIFSQTLKEISNKPETQSLSAEKSTEPSSSFSSEDT